MNSSDTHLDTRVSRLSTKKRPVVRLIIFATALACLLATLFAAWFIASAREAQIRQTRASTANIARMVEAQVTATMRTSRMALVDIAERVRGDGAGAAALERLRHHLVDLATAAPELHGLFVYGADGAWLATSLSQPVRGNNSDRAYFQYHRTHPGDETYIGAPIRSRSTGVWVIPVSRRISGPDGAFRGVALVTLKVNFFERVYDELDIGAAGTVVLALTDGTVVYRRPYNDKTIGMSIADGPLFREVRQRPVGSAFLVAKVDHVERLYSYRRLQNFPFVIAVGRSKDELLGNWRRSSILIGVAALLVSTMFAFLARRLIIQIVIRDRLDKALRGYSEKLEQHNLGLTVLAHTDKLTKIANRRRFDELFEQEFKRAKRSGACLSLILMDLDFFKQFNDRYGHPAGDACLQDAARVLTGQVVRAGDVAARYGGEEFAVIMPDTDLPGAIAVAERIRGGIAALQVKHASSPMGSVTASFGIATMAPGEGAAWTMTDLVERADKNLYEAKRAGRNRVCCGQV